LPTPIYQSARATLYCGDALAIMPLLPEKSVDLVFTDPPYGHNNNNGDLIARWEAATGRPAKTVQPEPRPIANDGPEADGIFLLFLYRVRRLLSDSCCCCCCCCGGGPDPTFARWSLYMDRVLSFRQQVIWDKGKMGLGWHYRRSVECVLVASKGRGKMRWYDDSHRIENIIRPGDYGIKKIIPSAAQHPTEKPVALPAHFIRLHSLPGDLVLDPFMGSGTTGVAALRSGRRFVGIEIDPEIATGAAARIAEAEASLPPAGDGGIQTANCQPPTAN